MNKFLSVIILLISVTVFSQTKEELDKVMVSKNAREIGDFINKYPNNSNVPFLRRKYDALDPNNSLGKPNSARVRTPEIIKQEEAIKKQEVVRKQNNVEKRENTTKILNHLLNGNLKSKEAYLVIKNKSQCNLVVNISGVKSYRLDVRKADQNAILIEKGTYAISANLCNAKYSSTKNITSNLEISLDAPKQKPSLLNK